MMAPDRKASQRGFWLTTFLFAIPFGLVTTVAGTIIAMQIAVARSSESANLGEYNAAFWSSILIGLLIFFGFCYLIVPIAMFVLGLLRLVFRAVKARSSKTAQEISQLT